MSALDRINKRMGNALRGVFQQKVAIFTSYAEVAYGMWLVAEALTPMRSLMTLLFTWQYLRIRYMIDGNTKSAFAAVNRGAVSMLPSFLATPYRKVASFMASQAELPQPPAPGQPQKGVMETMKERCTVM